MSAKQIVMAAAGSSGSVNYIEDVFSTYLYVGNGGTQTITNGIDLAGKGGMIWFKKRSGTADHRINDTNRGSGFPYPALITNSTAAAVSDADGVFTFNSNGFTAASGGSVNGSSDIYTSWTFRKQPKFFDVVTWTGDGVNGRQISHALGSTPGAIFLKQTNGSNAWRVYHRSTGSTCFDLTTGPAEIFNAITAASSTTFTVTNSAPTNASGATYVAYLFAHDAGGFGLSGADNVISCGSLTSGGSGVNTSVTLGYEPQWVLIKNASNSDSWHIADNMRGLLADYGQADLLADTSGAEFSPRNIIRINSTGFQFDGSWAASGETMIYIAIRRGPMRVPTSGTSVYNALSRAGNGVTTTVSGFGFPVDLSIIQSRGDNGSSASGMLRDRLRGPAQQLYSYTTLAEGTDSSAISSFTQDGYVVGDSYGTNGVDGRRYINHAFRRAPGFFDEVCYTGTGANRTVAHNLGAVPELMIVKQRNAANQWPVYSSALGALAYLFLETTSGQQTASAALLWNSTAPTASVFSLGTSGYTNSNTDTYVAYLFASCPGVSKVGAYTGNGSSQTINCGFASGARFVLIKRTDSTGNWYVWDTARGIVAANDPHLSLNSLAAEVTTNDSIDPDNSGFIVNQVAATNINVSSATYIYLAIA